MKTLISLTRALVIVAALAVVPAAAKAQTLGGSASAPSSFDAYRAMAITAGVVGGAAVATVLTDGLILPVLATATGGMGGGPAGLVGHVISVGGTVFGAVAGGLYADEWYAKQ